MTLNNWVKCELGVVNYTMSEVTYDRLDGVHGQPPLSRILVSVLIVAWWMLEKRMNDAIRLSSL